MNSEIRLTEYQSQFVHLTQADETYLRAGFSLNFTLGPRLSSDLIEMSTNQHVGILELPSGTRLLCEPKVPIRNLFQMMSWAYGLRQHFRDEITELDRLEDLIEFVILQFVELVESRIRRGLYRTYVEVQENLPTVRGRIDFNAQLRDNLVLKHRIACRYSDFTHDIPENQIIRQVVHRLVRWVSHAKLRVRLDELDAMLSDITPTQLPVSAIDQMHYHRLNDDYEPIHQLCRLFLEGASIDENQGVFDFNTFLVDMNALFERFVSAVLSGHLSGLRSISAQAHNSLDTESRISIKPDLVLKTGYEPVLIADTKYKRLYSGYPKNEDLYQMLAYCVALNVNAGVLIYPQHLFPTTARFNIRASDVTIKTLSLDLGVPFEQFDQMCADFSKRCWQLTIPDLNLLTLSA